MEWEIDSDNSAPSSYSRLNNNELIQQALRESYTNLNALQLKNLTLQSFFAPQNRKINIDGRNITASDLRYELANNIENTKHNPSYSSFTIDTANSIESINSGTSSTEEYFSWLNTTTEIIKNMNDGFVSGEDLDMRNTFIETTNQRETELMLCLGLLSGSNHPKADENARRILYKLQKLREMRSAIINSTRSKADVEISRAEYDRAIPYFKAFKALQKLPFGYDLNKQQKANLNIEHDEDEDLDIEFNHFDVILNQALDELLEGNSYNTNGQYQLSYDMARERNEQLSEDISEKMKKLTGRRDSFRLKYESLNENQNIS